MVPSGSCVCTRYVDHGDPETSGGVMRTLRPIKMGLCEEWRSAASGKLLRH